MARGLVTLLAVLCGILMLAPRDESRAQDCRAPGRPTMSEGRPPQFVLDNLRVLRRPRRPADALPRGLRRTGPMRVIYRRYTRYLGLRVGTRFYLVPGRTPPGCESKRAKPYTCLVQRQVGEQGAGWHCTPGRSVITSPGYGGGARDDGDGRIRYTVAGLARDGVARVEATFEDGTSRTVRVRRNLFAFTVVGTDPAEPGLSHLPTTMRYLDRDGDVVFERP